jgi:hypothetical protein
MGMAPVVSTHLGNTLLVFTRSPIISSTVTRAVQQVHEVQPQEPQVAQP